MSDQREAEVVLAKWRVVEQMLRDAAPESHDAVLLTDEWAQLRVEYQRLMEEARARHRPRPEPWPERHLVR